MIENDYEEMERLNYIEKNAQLISKLHLEELDTLGKLTADTHECILMLKDIKSLTSRDNLLVENIKPAISDLKRITKKIKALSELRTSIEYTLRLLDNICKASQNLTDELTFLQDINTGLFGRSDYIDQASFDYEKMYYFSEKYFDELILNIYLLIKQFELNGETKTKRSESIDLIQDVNRLIEIVLFLAEKCLPFTLFIRLPKVFKKCQVVGEEIDSKLLMLHVTKKLINLLPSFEAAINELKDLAARHKDKPEKKISLDPILNKKDGAEELGRILQIAKTLFKLL